MNKAAAKTRTVLGPQNKQDAKYEKENNNDIGADAKNIYIGDHRDITNFIMSDLGIDKYCRRDANQLSKIDEDPLYSFFVANIHLPLSTLKAYYKIIKLFEDYSPSL